MTGAPPASTRAARHGPPAAELLVHHIDQATLVPLARETSPGAPLPCRLGAFGPDGQPIPASIHHRGGHAADPPPYAEAEVTWDGDFMAPKPGAFHGAIVAARRRPAMPGRSLPRCGA